MNTVADEARVDGSALLVDIVRAVVTRTGHAAHAGGAAGDDGAWRVRPGDFWCYVHPPGERSRAQGWKLHISATPLSAPQVLAQAAEVLVRHQCRFKFAGTLARSAEIVSHRYDRGGGGKFVTAYPEGDEDQLRALAVDLHRATLGLPGPGILSDRPCFPGSLVHYRYGVFSGVRALSNAGIYGAMLIAPDGTLVPDRRKAHFSPPAWAPRDPFAPEPAGAPTTARPVPKPVLLDGRYLVREVIRHAFGGGVYRGTDETTGAAVVIKQARPHTAATPAGGDVRDRRRHEAAMLERFAPSGVTPRLTGLFEQQGDLFLVQEAIEGRNLREWVTETIGSDDGGVWGLPLPEAVRIARGLVGLMDRVHTEGWVLRDFNPNNVMVTADSELRLIDLEMLAQPGEQALRVYTPGYAAPEQMDAPRLGAAPGTAADLYSLGATLFYLVTSTDPLLAADEPRTRAYSERLANWLDRMSLCNPAARRLAPVILELMDESPQRRPALCAVLDRLFLDDEDEDKDAHGTAAGDTTPARRLADAELKQSVMDAIDHLLAGMAPDSPDRLWPSGATGTMTDPFNVQHGAAGVLGVLAHACAVEPTPALRAAVATAADWIRRWVGREPRTLPGLYYGRSGTAWALLDAGELLGDERLLSLAKHFAAQVPVRWPNPDICHGVAGAGLTQLRFWEATGEERFRARARQAADAAAAAAVLRDGLVLWPIPGNYVATADDITHYGFAHGVAGVGAFLLAAGRATGADSYVELAVRAGRTLLSVAEVDGGAAYWRSGEKGSGRKTHWCSGSSGVGTFLVRVWQETGADAFRELAHQAAVAVRRSRWHAGTAQCHGLAGDGEFLLDLAEASGDETYREWAEELAVSVCLRHVLRDGRAVSPDESGAEVWADFGTGLSGVLAFLMRLRHGGSRLWLPRSFAGTGVQDSGTAAADAAAVPANHHRSERG
ncbi:class IV lanthionine synthetase LanL [Streptomyces sp. NPDC002920]